MRASKYLPGLAALLMSGLAPLGALAQAALETIGKPVDGLLGFQPAVTELARDISWLDGMVNWIMGAILLLVVVLLAIVALRYNTRSNPDPKSFTHNTPVEVAWTLIPVVILVFITAFSLPVLFKQQVIPEGDIVIKATGNQWFWHYDYVDEGFGFDAYMIGQPYTMTDADHAAGAQDYVLSEAMRAKLVAAGYGPDEFLLATDNAVVIPVNKVVVVQVTGADVIHAWAVPAFGVKQDGVPGRIAELWFKAEREGTYFGQCSELCGKDHAYMPITVKVVSEAAYAEWLTKAKAEFAGLDVARPVRLASN
jgi:cytochrome c oxidase subunit 2